jgi:uncharacterized protein
MNYQSEPITMWIDRRLVLRKSLIQDIGTFAIELIPAGQLLILTTGGLVLTPKDRQSEAGDLEGEMYNEEWLPNGLRIATPKVFHYYVNHCCEPSAVDLSRSPNITQYVALQGIPAQEEITTDYGIFGGTRIDHCTCRSPCCRGRVTPDNWQLPELQQRYRKYLPRHVEQKIQQSNQHEDTNT